MAFAGHYMPYAVYIVLSLLRFLNWRKKSAENDRSKGYFCGLTKGGSSESQMGASYLLIGEASLRAVHDHLGHTVMGMTLVSVGILNAKEIQLLSYAAKAVRNDPYY